MSNGPQIEEGGTTKVPKLPYYKGFTVDIIFWY